MVFAQIRLRNTEAFSFPCITGEMKFTAQHLVATRCSELLGGVT